MSIKSDTIHPSLSSNQSLKTFFFLSFNFVHQELHQNQIFEVCSSKDHQITKGIKLSTLGMVYFVEF